MNASHRLRASLLVLAATLLLAACSGGAAGEPPSTAELIDPNPVVPGVGFPGAGGEITVPQPGQLGVHPIAADTLEAAVNGRAVTVRITFTSGVEPCSVLDTIVVTRDAMAFTISLFEGHAPGDNVCIDIAKVKHALVDLGELEPGTYAIRDSGGRAAPIEVVVS